MPRLKDKQVLIKSVQAAVSNMLPGPFAYAERWDETTGTYRGIVIDRNQSALIVIDSDSVIIKPDIAEQHRPVPAKPTSDPTTTPDSGRATPSGTATASLPGDSKPAGPTADPMPTRFVGTVMISPDRPAREIHQIVEAVIEQLTTLAGCDVSIKLEIDAEKPDGFDKAKVRTIAENANTLGFIDKKFS